MDNEDEELKPAPQVVVLPLKPFKAERPLPYGDERVELVVVGLRFHPDDSSWKFICITDCEDEMHVIEREAILGDITNIII